jgi:toxin-antitoxin system PIN domain toxin
VILCDVNIFLQALREIAPDHSTYHAWLTEQINSDRAFGVSPLVLSSVVRIATNRRVFSPPTPLATALAYCDQLRNLPQAVVIREGPRHWEIFTGLCRQVEAKGNLVPDAYLAALAIEHGCEWVSTDRDFARFPGLRWRHPLG